VFQNELSNDIPVVKTSIAGTRLVGRMTVGKQFIASIKVKD
jgi:translation initiation factor 6